MKTNVGPTSITIVYLIYCKFKDINVIFWEKYLFITSFYIHRKGKKTNLNETKYELSSW